MELEGHRLPAALLGAEPAWEISRTAMKELGVEQLGGGQPRSALEQRWAAPRLKTPPSSPAGQGVVTLSPVWTPDQRVDEHGVIGTSSSPSSLASLLRPEGTEGKEQRWRVLDTLIEDDDETVGAGEAVADACLTGSCAVPAPERAERLDQTLQASRILHQKVTAQLAASAARREQRLAASQREPEPEADPEPAPGWLTGVSSWLGNFWVGSLGPTADVNSLGNDTDALLRHKIHVGLMEHLDNHDEVAATCSMLLAVAHADSSLLRYSFSAWAAHTEWISWTENAIARFVWESEGETLVWAWKRWMCYFEMALRYHISIGRIVSSSGYGAVSRTWSTWRAWVRTRKNRRVVINKMSHRRCYRWKVTVLTRWWAYSAEVHHVQRISGRAVHRLMAVRQHAALARWRQMAMEQRHIRHICSQVLRRLIHHQLTASFQAWGCWVEQHAQLAGIAEQAILRWRRTRLAGAWGTWLDFTQQRTCSRQLVIKVLRKVAHLQLHFSLSQWVKFCVTTRRRKYALDRCLRRMQTASLSRAYSRWREHIDEALRRRCTLTKAVARMRTVALASALDGWIMHAREHRRSCAVTQRIIARFRSRLLCETLERWTHAVENLKARRLAEQVHERAVVEDAKQDVWQDLQESEDELPSQSYHHHHTDVKSRLRWEQEKTLLVLRSLAAEMRRVEEQQAREEDSQQHEALAKARVARSNAMEMRAQQARRRLPAQPVLVRRSTATLQHWAERGGRHAKAHTQQHMAFASVAPVDRLSEVPASSLLAGRSVATLMKWAKPNAGHNRSTGRT
jgi:hypothetical protein